jgi:TolB-like protein/class 3 adenylate cyclase/Flp pilus assembly protein TadD
VGESRKLAAILAADVVGYSRLVGADEDRTLARLRALRNDLIDPMIAGHNGRVVKRTGDGAIIEYRSAVDAVRCAIAVQRGMTECNADLPEELRIIFRMGVHVGDVVEEADGDLMGDGVNIASRLEGVCEPNGVCLSGAAYEQVRDRLKETFVDLGEKSLKNIARPVRVYALNTAAEGSKPQIRAPAQDAPAPPRLSIVVLPFANFGGDPEQEYFVDGVTESLTTDLSGIRGAFVIARNTAFTFKGKPFDVKAIGRELNVRYVLEGSVQRGAGRMRINVQLIDAGSGHHLWGERFDKPTGDLFDMQDEIVARLANQIDAHLAIAEARRAEKSPAPDSMDLYFQGRVWVNKGITAEYLARARDCFQRAAALDPGNLAALHGVAQVDALMAIAWLVPDRAERFKSAEETLIRLVRQEANNAKLHFTLGAVRAYTNRVPEGIAEYERALALDPNLAGAHGLIGNAKLLLGRPEEAEKHVFEALRLSPRDTAAYGWLQFVGNARLMVGKTGDAVEWFRRSIEVNSGYAIVRVFLAVALAELGRLEEARNEVGIAIDLGLRLTIRGYRESRASGYNPAYLNRREELTELMRKVGVPEGEAGPNGEM